jgi:hypothetical protein
MIVVAAKAASGRSATEYEISPHRIISNSSTGNTQWGGWGSNPRPADYEKYGPALPTLYLHGYHGAVPPMALIAL